MNRKTAIYILFFVTLQFASVSARLTLAQTPTAPNASDAGQETGTLDALIVERTPVPTATPGPVQVGLSEVAGQVGLDRVSILGITAEDWINAGISALIIIAGYLVGTWVIRRLLPDVVRRTDTEFDDRLLAVIGPDIRWMVVVLVVQFAILRLTFVDVRLQNLVRDLTFIIESALLLHIVWQLLSFAEEWFNHQAVEDGRSEALLPVIKLAVIVGRVAAIVFSCAILLSHFGIDITLFAATLGLTGLALSLGARSLITDLIAGITILIDQPFRIGDRIEVEGIDTWGDVDDIGLRSTRIRTLDNRMVIVPNSSMAENEVINYSYEDTVYRYETHVGIAYGTDVEAARRVIVETVSELEQVLSERPVDALYIEMGDSAMIFRVRWWMESYTDTRRILDKVHSSIQRALDDAGIEIPLPKRDVNLQVMPETIGEIAQTARPS